MNRRFLELLWAIPLLGVLSGCSDSSLTENSQNAANSIRFSVSAGKQTRATVTDNNTVTGEHFGLYAYTTDNDWVAGTTNPTSEPDVMNDQMVEYDSQSNAWTYSPLKFWSDKKTSFFGYWPKKDGVTEASIPDGTKLPVIKFTQEVTDPATMVDFLVAHELNKTKADGTVVMPFKHALTRLNFQARLDDNWGTKITDNTKILVRSLKVLGGDDSRFFSTASYQLGDGGDATDLTNGSWSYGGNDTKVATPLDVTSIMNTSSSIEVGTNNPYTYPDDAVSVNLDGTNTNLLKSNEYLFLIPPYGSTGIQSDKDVIVEISYEVVTKDDNITVNSGVVRTPTTAQVSMPEGKLQEGKAYNIIFTIGLDAIKVDADVTDWDADEAANAPAVNAASNSNADILAAWKSLNDSYKVTNKNTKYFAINVPDGAPATDIDLSSVLESDIANFDLGDQVELRFNGSPSTFSKTVLLPTGIGWTYQVRTVGAETHYILVKSDAPMVISESATANCYMINMAGKTTYFTFPLSQATKGWDKISGSNPDIASILQSGKWKIKTLWKTWSGKTTITGAKASSYTDATPTATLTIPRTVRNGTNAVVALVSSDDESIVYWSWHLWFTDYAPSSTSDAATNGQVHQYISDSFKAGGIYEGKYMMDRNLGATITGVSGAINPPTTTTEAVKYYGLLYQFGRKDPFMGSANGQSGTSYVKRYDTSGTAIDFKTAAGAGSAGTESKLAYAANNPLEFLTVDVGNWTTENTGLWGEDGTKSVFDPCPPGWRVPLGGTDATKNPWAGFRDGSPSATDNAAYSWEGFAYLSSSVTGATGCLYNNNNGSIQVQAWFPASGCLDYSSGSSTGVGSRGYSWSATPKVQATGFALYFTPSLLYLSNAFIPARAFPVRCVQE